MDHYISDVATLSRRLKPYSEDPQAVAAVALLLRKADENLELLIVKRVENPKDPWSGQMALPGGRREAKDRSLKETVIRETLEETGINLQEHCQFLGVLDNVRTIVRPGMKIIPFVVLLEKNPIIRLEAKELEDFIWVLPRKLRTHQSTVKFSYGEFPAYVVDNRVIWGLTYRILRDFIQIIS